MNPIGYGGKLILWLHCVLHTAQANYEERVRRREEQALADRASAARTDSDCGLDTPYTVGVDASLSPMSPPESDVAESPQVVQGAVAAVAVEAMENADYAIEGVRDETGMAGGGAAGADGFSAPGGQGGGGGGNVGWAQCVFGGHGGTRRLPGVRRRRLVPAGR